MYTLCRYTASGLRCIPNVATLNTHKVVSVSYSSIKFLNLIFKYQNHLSGMKSFFFFSKIEHLQNLELRYFEPGFYEM